MEFKVPKRHILRPTYPLTWCNKFCGGRGKRGALVEKARAHGKESCCNKFLMIFFFGEEKMKTRERSNLIFFSFQIFFWDIY